MDSIWDGNPSKLEDIGPCGGDENTKNAEQHNRFPNFNSSCTQTERNVRVLVITFWSQYTYELVRKKV